MQTMQTGMWERCRDEGKYHIFLLIILNGIHIQNIDRREYKLYNFYFFGIFLRHFSFVLLFSRRCFGSHTILINIIQYMPNKNATNDYRKNGGLFLWHFFFIIICIIEYRHTQPHTHTHVRLNARQKTHTHTQKKYHIV